MNKAFIFSNLFLLFLLISCEKDVDIEFNHEPKLCINCILNPDSLITASLTLSHSLDNSGNFLKVNDAIITLFEEGALKGKLELQREGKYMLGKKPLAGKSYKIIAQAPGFEQIEATTIVPKQPKIKYSKDTTGFTEYGNLIMYDLEVKIIDKPGKDNYWTFGTWEVGGIMYGGASRTINAPFIDPFNRIIDTAEKYGFRFFLQIRITDEGFDGQDLDFVIPDFVEWYEFKAQHFLNADENYDKYIKTVIINRLNETDELPFYEPIQIYSNIENGYGIFGSCAITTINL